MDELFKTLTYLINLLTFLLSNCLRATAFAPCTLSLQPYGFRRSSFAADYRWV